MSIDPMSPMERERSPDPAPRACCSHKSGWGQRWTGTRYCLGCGLPASVLAERAAETLAAVLACAREDTRWWEWRLRRNLRRATQRLDALRRSPSSDRPTEGGSDR
jgi:hypothetical protein